MQMEFCRGLLWEVVNKLECDLKEVISRDSLMAHLVDELLCFEKELRLTVFSPASEDGPTATPPLTVLTVLLDSVPFDKWRGLEKTCECMVMWGAEGHR
jgi:hypothetical protein